MVDDENTPKLDISRDDAPNDITFINILEFHEQVEGEIKCTLQTYTIHHILALDMVVYYGSSHHTLS